MNMPNYRGMSITEAIVEKILGNKRYFSKIRNVLGLDEVLVEKQEEIPWKTHVYSVGGIKKTEDGHIVRAAVAYRTPSVPPGEFDEHGDPQKRKEQLFEQKVNGSCSKNEVLNMIHSAIQALRQKNDSLKR
jgi:hypothetical protein